MALAPVNTAIPKLTQQLDSLHVFPPPLQLPPSISPKDSEDEYEVVGVLGEGRSIVLEVLTPRNKVNHLAMKLPVFQYGKLAHLKNEAYMLKRLQGIRHIVEYRDEFDTDLYYKKNNYLVSKKSAMKSHAILTEVLPPDTHAMFIKPSCNAPTRLLASDILDIGRQAFETLYDLHLRGILYLDLKPKNMSYDPDKRKLTIFDVGSASRSDEIDPSQFIGTLGFNAPEQMARMPYNASVDIWALALTLFQLYTGYPLIDAEGPYKENQTIIDCLHRMVKTVGKLSPTFIQSVPKDCKLFFARDGSILHFPSRGAKKALNYFDQIGRVFPGISIWVGCIHNAARLKKDTKENVKRLTQLLSKMFCYENRITAKEALKQFFPEVVDCE